MKRPTYTTANNYLVPRHHLSRYCMYIHKYSILLKVCKPCEYLGYLSKELKYLTLGLPSVYFT